MTEHWCLVLPRQLEVKIYCQVFKIVSWLNYLSSAGQHWVQSLICLFVLDCSEWHNLTRGHTYLSKNSECNAIATHVSWRMFIWARQLIVYYLVVWVFKTDVSWSKVQMQTESEAILFANMNPQDLNSWPPAKTIMVCYVPVM